MNARITELNDRFIDTDGACVLYWMQNDQRPDDNWALIRAVEVGNELSLPVLVGFVLDIEQEGANTRQYDFMLRGLAETARSLRDAGIGFVMRRGRSVDELMVLVGEVGAALVVTDQSQLNSGRTLRTEVGRRLGVRLEEVCANLIVPPSVLIDKPVFAAHQARRRLEPLLGEYLVEYPYIAAGHAWEIKSEGLDDQYPEGIVASLDLDETATVIDIPTGPIAARARLDEFIEYGIVNYAARRNDPNASGTSELSPYLHFGQISAQRVALEVVTRSPMSAAESVASFLDELITWRDVAANYTYFNKNYASYDGAPAWAKRSLDKHRNDPREYVYTQSEFESAQTHDKLWNAAQREMLKTGRMHGYMRMYWAKKILEWTESPEEAVAIAVYLNDKYELDGRDPNGYAGIMWAITGLHDRPWFDRPVYGQIRYMNENGARKKFDVDRYIDSL